MTSDGEVSGSGTVARLGSSDLEELVAAAREKYRIPSIAAIVIRSDGPTLVVLQGVRVHGTSDPTTLDDFFHIGSCSKSVLATIAAKMVSNHRIAWSTRFLEVFPELESTADAAYGGITLEDLFLCRAGVAPFTDGAAEPLPSYEASSTEAARSQFVRSLVGRPPASKKSGRGFFKHLYSNASYTMASAMLERRASSTYEELVRRCLTDELGLSFHIGWPNRLSRDQPWGHRVTRDGVDVFPPNHGYELPKLLTPAGDLSLTPVDFASYVRLHLRGLRGESDYLPREAFHRIHFSHRRFALGVANGAFGRLAFSAFDGSAGTFFCRALIVPQRDVAFTFMMNAGSGTSRMRVVDWLTWKVVHRYFGWGWRFWKWW